MADAGRLNFLWEERIFEKVVLTPAALGLIQWPVGTDCVLSLFDAWVKGKGAMGTGIHADWGQFDMPTMPPEAFGANFNYVLTDYTKADGALSFVPGSHRWRRWPSPEEAVYWNGNAQAIEAPAGSMIIWGDHLWHGSYPKETDGLRLMVLGMSNRPHMLTQEGFRETVTDAALARNPVRFAHLMNVYHAMPLGRTGRNTECLASAPRGYNSLFDTEPAGEKVCTEGKKDLLAQARLLATKEKSRPKQASLRRSVSAAYYALYHLLVDAATRRLVSGADRQPLRNCLARAFNHGVMKRVARQFAERSLSPRLNPGLNNLPLQDEIVRVAATFIDLQQHRHDADYNMGRQFTRIEALNIVSAAERAFVDWRVVRNSAQADTFIVGLLTFEKIRL